MCKLSRFFTLVYRQPVSRGEGVLRKDFCQVTDSSILVNGTFYGMLHLADFLPREWHVQVVHDNKFLILASSADAPGTNDATLTPTLPLHKLVTFYVVRSPGGPLSNQFKVLQMWLIVACTTTAFQVTPFA